MTSKRLTKPKPRKNGWRKPEPQVLPTLPPSLSIADRFDIDDQYFDLPVAWDGGCRDEWEDFD